MGYHNADEPDTLPYASQVSAWMAAHWRHGPCPVCGADEWSAEGRLFGVPRYFPAGDDGEPAPVSGTFRGVFPVLCTECGYTVWVASKVAGLHRSPIPDDLSGLTATTGHRAETSISAIGEDAAGEPTSATAADPGVDGDEAPDVPDAPETTESE